MIIKRIKIKKEVNGSSQMIFSKLEVGSEIET